MQVEPHIAGSHCVVWLNRSKEHYIDARRSRDGQRQQDYADAAQTRAQDAYDIVIEAIAKALGEKNEHTN